MIYTVTLNPSLDYVVRISELKPGNLHRSNNEELYVGGKGINVTTVLKRLGADSLSLGFIAGFTGKEIEHRLNQMGIISDFITIPEGLSRINVKLTSDQAIETEINGQGPAIGSYEMELLYRKLERIADGDILVLSGSVPGRLKSGKQTGECDQLTDRSEIGSDNCNMQADRDDTYAEICSRMTDRKVMLVVDAEGRSLKNTLKYRPFLIKPNQLELGRLFNRSLTTEESILECARKLQEEGAQNVLVSLAEEGALLLHSLGGVIRQKAPRGKARNSVGAGDSLVAGFLFGLSQAGKNGLSEGYSEEDYQRALKMGVAAGSAAAFTEGFPDKDSIDELYQSL